MVLAASALPVMAGPVPSVRDQAFDSSEDAGGCDVIAEETPTVPQEIDHAPPSQEEILWNADLQAEQIPGPPSSATTQTNQASFEDGITCSLEMSGSCTYTVTAYKPNRSSDGKTIYFAGTFSISAGCGASNQSDEWVDSYVLTLQHVYNGSWVNGPKKTGSVYDGRTKTVTGYAKCPAGTTKRYRTRAVMGGLVSHSDSIWFNCPS